MPNYSVVIKLKNQTKMGIESKLRAAFEDKSVEELHIIEAGMLLDCYYTCRSNNHFGCVHWTDEDLQSKFRELGIPVSEEILDVVKSSYLLRHIDDRMIELGWEIIEEAIVDAQFDQ
jgi:hypothetical protein